MSQFPETQKGFRDSFSHTGEKLFEHCLGGCFFHFSQAVMRAVQRLGLSTKYGNDHAFRLRIGKARALAFLPVVDVLSGWYDFVGEFEPDERCFVDYMHKVWIGEPASNRRRAKAPDFALDMWNVHDRALEKKMLTNNNAEAFHRWHKQLQPNTHPSIPTAIESLQAQTRISHLDCTKVGLGLTRQESTITQSRTAAVSQILLRYAQNLDRKECLDAIAQLYRTDNGH